LRKILLVLRRQSRAGVASGEVAQPAQQVGAASSAGLLNLTAFEPLLRHSAAETTNFANTQFRKHAVADDQFFVRADFSDPAIVEYDDAVAVLERREWPAMMIVVRSVFVMPSDVCTCRAIAPPTRRLLAAILR